MGVGFAQARGLQLCVLPDYRWDRHESAPLNFRKGSPAYIAVASSVITTSCAYGPVDPGHGDVVDGERAFAIFLNGHGFGHADSRKLWI